jgi:hypothetical protein
LSATQFKVEIASQPLPRLAIVSDQIFDDLISSGDVSAAIGQAWLPGDPKYKLIIDNLVIAAGDDPRTPMRVPLPNLIDYPTVYVFPASAYDETFPPRGRGSYQLFY